LFDPHAGGLKRPDIGGYIVDPMPDNIIADGQPVIALQVWNDPARRDAHRDPGLRAYLADMALRHGVPAIVRYSSQEGFILVAPCLDKDKSGKWLELQSNMVTQEELDRKIAGANNE
jgi:hypothetical protein